jgi:hypothetical protein
MDGRMSNARNACGDPAQPWVNSYDASSGYAAQHYANRLPTHLSGYCQPPREMTAADLGLPEYDISDYKEWRPFSFWLGREV